MQASRNGRGRPGGAGGSREQPVPGGDAILCKWWKAAGVSSQHHLPVKFQQGNLKFPFVLQRYGKNPNI